MNIQEAWDNYTRQLPTSDARLIAWHIYCDIRENKPCGTHEELWKEIRMKRHESSKVIYANTPMAFQ